MEELVFESAIAAKRAAVEAWTGLLLESQHRKIRHCRPLIPALEDRSHYSRLLRRSQSLPSVLVPTWDNECAGIRVVRVCVTL